MKTQTKLLFSLCVIGYLVFAYHKTHDCPETDLYSTHTYRVSYFNLRGDIATELIQSQSIYYDEIETEVESRLSNFINSGNHNIISVKTFYKDGHLVMAEVRYDVA